MAFSSRNPTPSRLAVLLAAGIILLLGVGALRERSLQNQVEEQRAMILETQYRLERIDLAASGSEISEVSFTSNVARPSALYHRATEPTLYETRASGSFPGALNAAFSDSEHTYIFFEEGPSDMRKSNWMLFSRGEDSDYKDPEYTDVPFWIVGPKTIIADRPLNEAKLLYTGGDTDAELRLFPLSKRGPAR